MTNKERLAGMSDEDVLAEMKDTYAVFFEDDKRLINLNDTFAYACADAEIVKEEQVPEIVKIYRDWGHIGLICWSAKQRNEEPVIEYTEDPVYQATWKAMYGDLIVGKNGFNQFDPRWSDDKLHLQAW